MCRLMKSRADETSTFIFQGKGNLCFAEYQKRISKTLQPYYNSTIRNLFLHQSYIISILRLVIPFHFALRWLRSANKTLCGRRFVASKIILKYHKTVKLAYYLGKKLTQANSIWHMKTWDQSTSLEDQHGQMPHSCFQGAYYYTKLCLVVRLG